MKPHPSAKNTRKMETKSYKIKTKTAGSSEIYLVSNPR